MGQSCQGGTVVDSGPNLQDTSDKIGQQIQKLESKIHDADQQVRRYAALASSDKTAKMRAMQLLKQKKMFEQQRDRLLGTRFNVQNVEFQREQADLAYTAALAMQKGQQRLREVQERMPVDALEQLADSIEETAAELKDAQDALARESGFDAADADMDGEWARLQEEVAQEEQREQEQRRRDGAAGPSAGRRPLALAADNPQGRRRLLGVGA